MSFGSLPKVRIKRMTFIATNMLIFRFLMHACLNSKKKKQYLHHRNHVQYRQFNLPCPSKTTMCSWWVLTQDLSIRSSDHHASPLKFLLRACLLQTQRHHITQLSPLMGKPTICIGENKDADQLRGNREADQRLCFRFSDSTIPLLFPCLLRVIR